MVIPLLSTKYLIPPIAAHRIERLHLLQKLDEGLSSGKRLLLVCAPAGYGKTSLVLEWANHLVSDRPVADTTQPVQVAWLACEAEDSDLARFLTYLVAAFQQVTPGIGEGILATFHASRLPSPAALATLLINDLASIQKHFVLVLDDFHTISGQAIPEFLTYLVEHQSPRLTLVVATRADPPFPLARLRARAQLAEIRQKDLSFSLEEAAGFLGQTMGVRVTPAQLSLLEKRTEGWPAGLQLAALSMQAAPDVQALIDSFSGEHEFIADYLANEVLAQQSGQENSFLLQTSILERLSAPLCAAVTGDPDSGTILERLRDRNLFLIPLDHQKTWYRYHALFADLLRNRLHRQHPERVEELQLRASRWHQEQGLRMPAVEYALAGHAFEQAAVLLESSIEAVFIQGQVVTISRWLETLPDAVKDAHPLLWIFHRLALIWSGKSTTALKPVPAEQAPIFTRAGLSGEAHTMEALYALAGGRTVEAAALADDALRELPPERALFRCLAADALGMIRTMQAQIPAAMLAFEELAQAASQAGYEMFEIIALSHLAGLHLQVGHLNSAATGYQRALDLAIQTMERCSPPAGNILLGLGEVARERNDLESALRYFTEAVEVFSQFSEMGLPIAHLSIARLAASQGNWLSAQEHLEKARQVTQASRVTRLNDRLVAGVQARFWIAQGDLASAERWAQESGILARPGAEIIKDAGSQAGSSEFIYADYLTLARLYLAQDRPDDALQVIDVFLAEATRLKFIRRELHLLVLKALALQQKKEVSRAIEMLGLAVEIAAPEGYKQVFVDEGEPLARLLYQGISHAGFSTYAKDIWAAFKQNPAALPLEHPPSTERLVEPLSEREREVLALIAAGLSNQQICARLHLSLSTVKGHTSNIYGKLGVSSRTQAISEAARLGILT